MNTIIQIAESPYSVEFSIDLNVFPLNVCLRSVYTFLDRWYFYFEKDLTGNKLIVKAVSKNEKKWSSEKLLSDLSDELLATTLRESLERDNKTIRDAIVMKALWSMEDHSTESSEEKLKKEESYLDFSKDVDSLLKEIENISVEPKKQEKTIHVNDVFHAKKAFKNR